MEVREFTLESEVVDADYDVVVYGDGGAPVIVFPEGDGTATSWENGGMTDALSELVDAGKAQLFCVDSADAGSWYAVELDPEYRLDNLKGYLRFVEEELLPFVAKTSGTDAAPILAGAGLGALNATLEVLRRPQIFGGLLALSGTYDVRAFVGVDPSAEWLAMSPVDLAAGLSDEGRDVLAQLPLAFVSGQDGSETGIESQRALDTLFAEAKIPATFEYWGYDVSHDWYWWQEEARQLLPSLLVPGGLTERVLVAAVSTAKAESDHANELLDAAGDEQASAQAALEAALADEKATSERSAAEDAVVAERQADEEKLRELAKAALAERDRIAAELEAANRANDEAWSVVNAAAAERSSAEWIAGEARAAAAAAEATRAAAEARVAAADAAVTEATDAAVRATAALAEAQGRYDAQRAELAAAEDAKPEPVPEPQPKPVEEPAPAEAAPAKAAPAKPAAKKAPARKPAAKKASTARKAPAKKPAARKPAASSKKAASPKSDPAAEK